MAVPGKDFGPGRPQEGRRDRDWYPTPPEGTEAILPVLATLLHKDAIMWEPFAGDGRMSDVLSRVGCVLTSDIHPLRDDILEHDFFSEEWPFDFEKGEISAIVSNPPFKIAEEIIRKARREFPDADLVLLLKSTYFHAANRVKLFRDHPPNMILPLTFRLDFLSKGRPVDETTWFLWSNKIDLQNHYEPLGRAS